MGNVTQDVVRKGPSRFLPRLSLSHSRYGAQCRCAPVREARRRVWSDQCGRSSHALSQIMQALLVLQCLGKHGFWNMMLFVALPALADILNLPVPPSAPVSLSPNQGGCFRARAVAFATARTSPAALASRAPRTMMRDPKHNQASTIKSSLSLKCLCPCTCKPVFACNQMMIRQEGVNLERSPK